MQSPYRKKFLKSLPAGTWVLLAWSDNEPTWALLLEPLDKKEKGEVSLNCFHVQSRYMHADTHAVHTQIIQVGDRLEAPIEFGTSILTQKHEDNCPVCKEIYCECECEDENDDCEEEEEEEDDDSNYEVPTLKHKNKK